MNRSFITAATIIAVVLVTALIGVSQETLSERSERIAAMSATDKAELRVKLERFERLPSDERNRRIELNDALESHPEGEQLREVMDRYYDWLKTVDQSDRIKLQGMPVDQRIVEIKKIIGFQERQRFDELTRAAWQDIKPRPEDFAAIRSWFDEWLVKHQEEILANEPKLYAKFPWLEKRMSDLPPDRNKLSGIWAMSFRSDAPGINRLTPTEEELNELATRLDKDTQSRLNKEPSDRRMGLLNALMKNAFMSHMHERVSDEELQQFYRQLPERRQAELAGLPPESFDKELRGDYMRANSGRYFGGNRPGNPPPWDRDGRRGEDREGGRRGGGPGDRGPGERGPDGRGPGGPPGMRDGRGPRPEGPRPNMRDGNPPPPMQNETVET
ncbi:hypothetical protein [Bremerella cremea]|uniref:hypothetical protein n=1 Tax=Bremerella cremea TaxID=1031537 RepID=UPI0031F028FB